MPSHPRADAPAPATPWAEARALAGSLPGALEPVTVPLGQALGTVLSRDVHALAAVPAVDTAAMDGFAVAGHPPWTVVGQTLAGQPPPRSSLAPGECMEVATGAALPEGVEAVLPYEYSSREGMSVRGDPLPGRHIRARAEGWAQGERLVPAGRLVTPAAVGLAASVGCDHLDVIPHPDVTVLVTGEELQQRGVPASGRVRDAIGPMLPGLVARAGGSIGTTRRLPDDRRHLDHALRESAGDVVVISGGSSAGPADHVRGLLAELGARVVVTSVACRPGHPQLLARLPDGRWLVGLPGNPYAALGAVATLLTPLLGALAGRGPSCPVFGHLAHGVEPHPRDTRLVSVTREGQNAHPVGRDRAGQLWGAALADALAVIPPATATRRVELLEL